MAKMLQRSMDANRYQQLDLIEFLASQSPGQAETPAPPLVEPEPAIEAAPSASPETPALRWLRGYKRFYEQEVLRIADRAFANACSRHQNCLNW
jgi:hypothetical protein